jgi:hypothetical protein
LELAPLPYQHWRHDVAFPLVERERLSLALDCELVAPGTSIQIGEERENVAVHFERVGLLDECQCLERGRSRPSTESAR